MYNLFTEISIVASFITGGVVLIISLIVFLRFRNYYRKKLQLLTDQEIEEFQNGNSKSDTHAFILPYSMNNEISQQDITILGSLNFLHSFYKYTIFVVFT